MPQVSCRSDHLQTFLRTDVNTKSNGIYLEKLLKSLQHLDGLLILNLLLLRKKADDVQFFIATCIALKAKSVRLSAHLRKI